MLELLRDPLWQFIGALLAVVAILVSIWVYYAQRPRKRLLVERFARVPLVARGSNGITGLRVTFAGRELQSALVVLVRVQCIGNIPILAVDYESPIRFQFEENAVVLSADPVDTEPEGIPIVIECQGSSAFVSKQLLNPADSFVVRLLVENSRGKMLPNARIAGVAKLELARSLSIVQPLSAILGIGLIAFAAWYSPDPKSVHPWDIRPDEMPYAIAGAVGVWIAAASVLLQMKTIIRRVQDHLSPYRQD